jgi:hypothetical protein
VAAGLLLAIWFLSSRRLGVSPDRIEWERLWRASLRAFHWGRGGHGVSLFTSVIWIAIACLMVSLPLRDRHKPARILDRHALFLLLTTLAALLLPFQAGDYTFINMRMSSIAYFLLAMVSSRIRFRGVSRYALAVLVLALLGHGVAKQWRISDEIARAEPVVTEIPRNARVLPLVLANDSPELEARVFDLHLHVHDYYHILVGGGFSPYFRLHR